MKRKNFPSTQTRLQIMKFVQLKSRMNLPDLAKELGVTYWSLYLMLKRANNHEKEKRNTELRTKIADRLGVAYDDLWGPDNQEKIKKLIESEIKTVVIERALECQKDLEKRMMVG